MTVFRIGHGYDVHKFGSDKKLMLCGIEIPSDRGVMAHSDGDIPIHALCDALLGAAGKRDIGYYFPDSDEKYKNISGEKLLGLTLGILKESGFSVLTADITIIAEKPRLSAYIPQMTENLKRLLCTDAVNVKATTEEGIGLAGLGIGAHAVCILDNAEE